MAAPDKFQDDIKQFGKLVELFTERLTRKEFVSAFSEVAETVAKVREDLTAQVNALADAIETHKASLSEENGTLSQHALATISTSLTQALASIETKIAELDAKLALVKDGKDGETPDINEVAKLAASLIQLPEYRAPIMDGPDEIRNKLEAAYAETDDEEERIDPRIIRGFQALVKDIEDLKKRPVAGSTNIQPSHWPRHETFTMNGADTTVTLQEGVGGEGSFIFGVRYNGQTLDWNQFSVNGNKITLTFTPDSGEIISVSYMS